MRDAEARPIPDVIYHFYAMNILIFRELGAQQINRLQTEFRDCSFECTTDPARLEALLTWAEVLYGNAPLASLKRATRLKWVQIVSSGFDEYAGLQGEPVLLTTARGIHAPIIAQHALMTILMFARGQLHFGAKQAKAEWDRRPGIPRNLSAQTVGLIGCGTIATSLAGMLRPLGVRIIATRRDAQQPPPPAIDAVFPISDLDVLLGQSDHVVLTLPLTRETRNILNRERIAAMKPGSVLHNVARGGLLDEDALIERLQAGSLSGAALDVFAQEPLPASSPFWHLPNVIVTPHIAGHHCELGLLTLERFIENFHRYRDGRPLLGTADFARGY